MSEQILVTFWGTRGSIAAPGRSTEKYGGNTSCVAVEFSDSMDVPKSMKALGVDDKKIDLLAKMAVKDPSAGGNPIPLTEDITQKLYQQVI